MTTAAFVVGSLCGLVIICQFAWIIVALHMAYTKTDMILEHFRNSSSIRALAPMKHSGLIGRLRFIGGISSFVTFPNFYKHANISTEELKSFSAPLKRKLVALQWCVICLFGAMALFVVLYKLIKAYNL